MQLIIVVLGSAVLGQVEEIVPIIDKIIEKAAVMSYIRHFNGHLPVVKQDITCNQATTKSF